MYVFCFEYECNLIAIYLLYLEKFVSYKFISLVRPICFLKEAEESENKTKNQKQDSERARERYEAKDCDYQNERNAFLSTV